MASPRVSQSSGHSCWKQWWKRSPNTCCSKKILLLLVWQVLFAFSWSLLVADVNTALDSDFVSASLILSFCCAPLIGWLADVKFGRYEVIKIGSLASFFASIFVYFAITTGGATTGIGNVLMSVATTIVCFGFSCYSASILKAVFTSATSRLQEKANNTCHTSSNSIFLLQQVLGDLFHHCFQQL